MANKPRTTPTIERLAIYCRVSSEEQREKQSIQMQVSVAENYVQGEKLKGREVVLTDWYKDDGISGTIPIQERPEGARLLQDARNGRFSRLVVWKIDRLGRQVSVIINMVDELEKLGVAFTSITESFDTSSSSGRLMMNMLASFADFEHDTIIERSITGTNERARAGQWLGGIVPYGYEVTGTKRDAWLKVCERQLPNVAMTEADVVRLMYRRLADEHKTCRRIADELNGLGVPPAYVKDNRQVQYHGKRKANTAGTWVPSRVRSLVINPVYKGTHVYGRRSKKQRDTIARSVPAIVDEATWTRAVETLHQNLLNSPRGCHREYLLHGIIKCGHCGMTYSGCAYHGKDRYYRCNGRIAYRGPAKGNCPGKIIKAEPIEEAVWREVEKLLLTPNDVLMKLGELDAEGGRQHAVLEAEKLTMERTIADKDTERARIMVIYRRGLIDADDVDRQLAAINAETESAKERLSQVERELANAETLKQRFTTIEDRLADIRAILDGGLTYEVKRQIVELLVSRVQVTTVGEGRDRHIEAAVVFAIDRNALHSDYTDRRAVTTTPGCEYSGARCGTSCA